jgi:hypothetical protein
MIDKLVQIKPKDKNEEMLNKIYFNIEDPSFEGIIY